MVVDHDDIHAFGSETVDFWFRVRAAIEGDEELRLGFGQHALQGGHRKAVALLQAARDKVFRLGTETAEEVDEHRGARDTIDVVVAQDGDTLTLGGSEHEAFGGFAQATDRKRIGDMGELGAEMTLRLGLVRKGTGENSG